MFLGGDCMRISKDSEERKSEIVDAAEKLFAKNGIANTALSAIVKELNVAQGLFYYYFKSKDDVIDELVRRYNQDFKKNIEKNLKNSDFQTQLNTFVENVSKSFEEFWKKFDDSNTDIVQLTSKSIDDAKKIASDELTKILKKGNEDEELDIKSPEYYAKIIVGGISDLISQGMKDVDEIKKIVNDLIKKEKKDE